MIDAAAIPYVKNPRLLGVYLECQLSFNYHTKHITKEATNKLKLLAAVSYSEWGWQRDNLKKLYSSFARSNLDYAAASWQPWLSETGVGQLN